jgi:DNA polymerase III subunit beta
MTQGVADLIGPEAGTPFDGATPPVAAAYDGFRFSCQRFLLLQLAERAGNVIPLGRDNYQTVLSNFHLAVKPGQLTVTGSDLEIRVIATTPAVTLTCTGSEDPPPVVLPAKRLLAILREAADGEVAIEVSGDQATVSAGTASWALKLSSDGRDYPAPPDLSAVEWQECKRLPLLGALEAVRHAVSKSGSNPSHGQVDIRSREADGVPCVTACDRTRFAQVPLEGFPLAMRIPAVGSPPAVQELMRLLKASQAEKVRVALLGRRLLFGIDSTVFMVSQLPMEYPDVWGQLLEPTLLNQDTLEVGCAELESAIRQVRINADDATAAIGLQLTQGRLTVFAQDKYGNQAEQPLDAGWSLPDRTLIVNHEFLTQMLAVHPAPKCVFRLGKDAGRRKAPVLLRDEESGVTGIINQMADTLLRKA